MARRALIVGGGWAGCAAAWRLASRGLRVTLCEAGPRLGGRASSFKDSSGLELDNGQHLFLGAYKTVLAMLRDLGQGEAVRLGEGLRVHYLFEGGRIETLAARKLPGPLALGAGLADFRALSRAQRRALLGHGLSLGGDLLAAACGATTPRLETLTAEQWLREAGQPEEALRLVWEPMCLAALNARLSQAQALGLAQVLSRGFLKGGRTASLGDADRPLSALLQPAMQEWLEARGGTVRLKAQVKKLDLQHGRVKAAVLQDNQSLAADVFVLALPLPRLKKILGQHLGRVLDLSASQGLEYSPIVSAWLWTSKPLTSLDFGAFASASGVQPDFHWFFNKDDLLRQAGRRGHLSCVVASAADDLLAPAADLQGRLVEQLKKYFPGFDPTAVARVRVVKELSATPCFVPGSSRFRPGAGCGLANLALAGDWTQTGLPATLEGAALSGLNAARALGA